MNKEENLTDTILESFWFECDCPMGFGFSLGSDEDKAQDKFFEENCCEKNCDDNYKECWRKYFKILKSVKEEKCQKDDKTPYYANFENGAIYNILMEEIK